MIRNLNKLSNSSLLSTIKTCVNQLRLRTSDSVAKANNVERLVELKQRGKLFDAVPHKKRHRSEWEWNYRSELFAFSKRLKEDFNLHKLRQAFTHNSHKNLEDEKRLNFGISSTESLPDNTELSSKGGPVLEHHIVQYLRHYLPRAPEDCISSLTNYLLSDEILMEIGQSIGCKDLIVCSEIDPLPDHYGNTMRSLISILNEDAGYISTRLFIVDFIISYLNDKDFMTIWQFDNPELHLERILHNDHLSNFEVRLLRESGRNTIFSSFLVGLYSDQKYLGEGCGKTIELAKEIAAYDALRRLFGLRSDDYLFKYGEYHSKTVDLNQKLVEHRSLADWKMSDYS